MSEVVVRGKGNPSSGVASIPADSLDVADDGRSVDSAQAVIYPVVAVMVAARSLEDELRVNQSAGTIVAEHDIVPDEVEQRHVPQVDDVICIAVDFVAVVVQIVKRDVKERSEGDAEDAVDDRCASIGVPSSGDHGSIPNQGSGPVGTCGRRQRTAPVVVGVVVVEIVAIVVVAVIEVVVGIVAMVTSVVVAMIASAVVAMVVTAVIAMVASTVIAITTRPAVAVRAVSVAVRTTVSTTAVVPITIGTYIAVAAVIATVGLVGTYVAIVATVSARAGSLLAVITHGCRAGSCHRVSSGALGYVSRGAAVAAAATAAGGGTAGASTAALRRGGRVVGAHCSSLRAAAASAGAGARGTADLRG